MLRLLAGRMRLVVFVPAYRPRLIPRRGDCSDKIAIRDSAGRRKRSTFGRGGLDGGGCDARNCEQRLFHTRHAGRAGHAIDGERDRSAWNLVACVFDRPNQPGLIDRLDQGYIGTLGGKVDRRPSHAFNAVQGILDSPDAGRTGHPDDR